MNAILEKVSISTKQSFAIKEEILPYIKIGWHFHPEYELVYFTESTGRLFVGDFTDTFGPGEFLLIGPNLPHFMRNDAAYYTSDPSLRIRAIVVHFREDFLGSSFFNLPEFTLINRLLKQSVQGLRISGNTRQALASDMEALLTHSGYERLMKLLDVLHHLADSPDLTSLSSAGFTQLPAHEDTDRVNQVFEYLLTHYTDEVTLTEAAAIANLSVSAFCKFFKKRTGKTFSHSLNEIRIGHACKLFMEQDLSVKEVCFQSGFNNLSYFNRKFKDFTKTTPLAYRSQFVYRLAAATT
jgi:AraC-like DNA-binding protein